jgi:membrane-associated protease RseP (regulator of RpoE activity)
MKRDWLRLAIFLLLTGVGRPASPPAVSGDTVQMKPFVVAAVNVFVQVKWITDRATRTPRVLLMQVSELNENSAAYAAGLRVNMVIDAIDGSRVEDRTQEELTKIMSRVAKKEGNITLTVLQGLDKRKIRIPLDDTVEAKKK